MCLVVYPSSAVFTASLVAVRLGLAWPCSSSVPPALEGTCDGEGKIRTRCDPTSTPRHYAVVPPDPSAQNLHDGQYTFILVQGSFMIDKQTKIRHGPLGCSGPACSAETLPSSSLKPIHNSHQMMNHSLPPSARPFALSYVQARGRHWRRRTPTTETGCSSFDRGGRRHKQVEPGLGIGDPPPFF